MKQEDEKLIWFIVFCCILAFLATLIIFNIYENKTVDLRGVEVSKKNLRTIQNAFNDENLAFVICNIKDKKCIQMISVDNYNKFIEKVNG